jgi:hypothetical protein
MLDDEACNLGELISACDREIGQSVHILFERFSGEESKEIYKVFTRVFAVVYHGRALLIVKVDEFTQKNGWVARRAETGWPVPPGHLKNYSKRSLVQE